MATNECFMCGGNDFTVTDGAFVCTECGIQSQTIREEEINFNENAIVVHHDAEANKDHEIMAGSQLGKHKKLLSWECFNLILLGLTNEVIELGAKPNLKIIVLQLWVRYLQHIEAAFTSKKYKKLPKLNSRINNVDCEILYGVSNVRKKVLETKTGLKFKTKKEKRKPRIRKRTFSEKSLNSSASSAITTSQKRQRVTRKLQKLDYSSNSRVSNIDSTDVSSDVSLLQRSKKSSKVKIKFTKTTKESFTSMPSKSEGLTYEESLALLDTGKKLWTKLKMKDDKSYIRIRKLIAIIQLALMINDDDIYLADLLRWIQEGHFHINQVNIFLPENVIHGINLQNMLEYPSRFKLNKELGVLLGCFGTKQLPKIDYKKLVLRYCDELQLPTDFPHFVYKLISLCAPRLWISKVYRNDIEIKIMAYVVFAAKFLFGLDDKTEHLSSDFAEKVNRSKKVDKQLFSWNSYVEYIECRYTITSNYIYSLHKNMYGDTYLHNTELFINSWNLTMPTLPIKNQISQGLRDNTECLLKLLPNNGAKESFREIPASTTPLSSTLKWVIEYYPTQLSSKAKQILENDFAKTDILYLTDEKIINDLADQCGISVEVISNLPLHYTKKREIYYPTNVRTAKPKVYLTNRFIPTNENKPEDVTTVSSRQENPNTIFLGTGSNYWYIDMHSTVLSNASKFEPMFKNKFPHSFQWFMKQCCRLLNCGLSEMYQDLIMLENKFKSLLRSGELDCSS